MSDIRYNNEFCIVRENGTNDIVINELLSARVETLQQIEKHSDLSTINADCFTELPKSGWVEKKMYNYNGKTVICIQPHNRTIYPPEQTPALFSFFRTNSDELNWIENEKVEIGWKRMFEGKQYECIQSHISYQGYQPINTLGVLWNEVVVDTEVKPPQWVTGDYYKYTVGSQVFDSGKVWEAINTTHTWIKPALEGNGAISWKFVKDWI